MRSEASLRTGWTSSHQSSIRFWAHNGKGLADLLIRVNHSVPGSFTGRSQSKLHGGGRPMGQGARIGFALLFAATVEGGAFQLFGQDKGATPAATAAATQRFTLSIEDARPLATVAD